jgi:hypothetical protein
MSQAWRPGHEAGSAFILAVLDAARELIGRRGFGLSSLLDRQEAALVTAVTMLDGAVSQLTPRPTWRTTTWAEVVELGTGTRVRLGGQEAVVNSADIQTWHVDPRSSEYRPRSLEYRVVSTWLSGRDQLYGFPPEGPVEVLDVEWPPEEESLASWVAAAGAVLEFQAMHELKRTLGAEEL